jgi:hypothetical protein
MRYQVGPDVSIRYCSSCKAPIVWHKTDNGKSMPLSWKTRERQVQTDLAGKETTIGYSMDTHFADCPNAKRHSGKGKGNTAL